MPCVSARQRLTIRIAPALVKFLASGHSNRAPPDMRDLQDDAHEAPLAYLDRVLAAWRQGLLGVRHALSVDFDRALLNHAPGFGRGLYEACLFQDEPNRPLPVFESAGRREMGGLDLGGLFAPLMHAREMLLGLDRRSEEHTSELQSLRHFVCR